MITALAVQIMDISADKANTIVYVELILLI